MAIKVPGKRWGKRLEKSKVFGHGGHTKKTTFADLLITPLVDMFVIIVVFLIANFSATGEILNITKDVELPEAVNVQELQMDPVVMVSAEQVVVDGHVVGRVEDFMKDDSFSIPALEEKLREMKKRTDDLHTAAGSTEQPKAGVNIQGHKDVPFKIIKKVMYSAASSGFLNINFAALSTGDMQAAGAQASAPTP